MTNSLLCLWYDIKTEIKAEMIYSACYFSVFYKKELPAKDFFSKSSLCRYKALKMIIVCLQEFWEKDLLEKDCHKVS
jgi:hypothetical protein